MTSQYIQISQLSWVLNKWRQIQTTDRAGQAKGRHHGEAHWEEEMSQKSSWKQARKVTLSLSQIKATLFRRVLSFSSHSPPVPDNPMELSLARYVSPSSRGQKSV